VKVKRNIATYNVLLNPDEATYKHWAQLLRDTAGAYNLCIDLLSDRMTLLNIRSVHCTCYHKVRNAFPELPSQSVIRAQKEAMSALRSKNSNQHDGLMPEKKALSTTLDKRMYSRLTENSIALCGGEKNKRVTVPFVTYPKLMDMFHKYKPCDPVIFMRNDKLYLSIPFNLPEVPLQNDNSVGVDLGIKRLFTTSEGFAFRDKEYLKHRRKIRYMKRCLRSNGTKSARRHLRKIRHKELNLSKEMQYRAVNTLLRSTDASILVLEDLSKIKQTTKKGTNGCMRKRHNNMISQVPFYGFKTKLEAKAPLYGKKVETVNPAFTSQQDCRTGKKTGTRRGCRYYCKDKKVFDADWNAALNIAKKGKHPYSNLLPVDGGLRFLNGRAPSTAQSYVNPNKEKSL
jgi:IS605 OrfB family transposase